MDPVTHAVVARMAVALDRRTSASVGHALPILGGLAPDIDSVFMPVGWDIYLRVHESWTHSIPGIVLVAAGLAGLFRWRRGTPYRTLFIAALIAVASHVALDALSGATIRLAWPLLAHRTNFGLVAMSDPWFVAPLVIGLLVIVASRWRLADAAPYVFVVLGILLAGKLVSRQLALSAYASARKEPVDARYVHPAWGSLTGWWIYDRVQGRVRTWRVDAGERNADVILDAPAADVSAMVHAESRFETVRNFLLAHDLPIRVSVTSGDTTRVFWSDLRFCWRPEDGGGPAPGTHVRPSAAPIACGVWFGGSLAPDGRVLRQFVTVGEYVQER